MLLKLEASLDPSLKPVADAPPLPEDIPPPPPQWMQERLHEINESARESMSEEEWERLKPRIAPEHELIEARARDYCTRAHAWLTARQAHTHRDPGDPRAIIGWFHSLFGQLERVFPRARAFVRPAFDEPDEVARLI